jgi:hypothetical protein
MKITWIDKKSTLLHGKNTYKAGDTIPAGILSASRLDTFVKAKKIRIGDPVADASVKVKTLMGLEVAAKVILPEPEPVPEPVEEKKPRGRGRKQEEEDDE